MRVPRWRLASLRAKTTLEINQRLLIATCTMGYSKHGSLTSRIQLVVKCFPEEFDNESNRICRRQNHIQLDHDYRGLDSLVFDYVEEQIVVSRADEI